MNHKIVDGIVLALVTSFIGIAILGMSLAFYAAALSENYPHYYTVQQLNKDGKIVKQWNGTTDFWRDGSWVSFYTNEGKVTLSNVPVKVIRY